jgi:hypothetical protein
MGEFQRKSICGQEHLVSCGHSEIGAQFDGLSEGGIVNRSVFEEQRSRTLGGAREAADSFAGVNGATGDRFCGAQLPGIVPANWRVWQRGGAAEFVDAGQGKIGVDVQSFQDVLIASQHVAEAGQIAGGGFGQGNSTGMAASTCAKGFRFKQSDRFLWGEMFQPNGRGQAGEPTADNGEIDGARKFALRGVKIDGPRAISPVFHGEQHPL